MNRKRRPLRSLTPDQLSIVVGGGDTTPPPVPLPITIYIQKPGH